MDNKIIVRFLNKADRAVLWEATTTYEDGEVVIGRKEEIQLGCIRLSGERIVEVEVNNGQKDGIEIVLSDKDYFPHMLLVIKEAANGAIQVLFQ